MVLYTFSSNIISPNVLGNWRFFVPDKENAKRFTGKKKCGVVRRGNGFSHDLAERNPKCPDRAFCSYRLLYEGKTYCEAASMDAGGFYIIFQLY